MKLNLSKAVAFSLALTCVAGARAQDAADLEKCINDQPSAIDIAQCLQAIYKKEDDRLNALYKKAVTRAKEVSPETVAELKKSQLAWIKLRDGWCAFEARWEGGTAAKTAGAYCLALTTRKRNGDLVFYAGESASARSWKR